MAAEIDGRRIDRVDPIELGPFTPQGPQRRAVFVDAAEAFAHALEIPAAPVVPPGDLDHPAYASPLTVHMAALAAVTATQEGCESPGRHELSRYLLTHEYRYWNAAASETVPYSIRRTVFVATLFGPIANERQARALLRQAGLADGDAEAERLVRVHEKLYPTSRAGEKQRSPTPGDVLLPLHPDRLGEDFVAEELAPGSGRADADATG